MDKTIGHINRYDANSISRTRNELFGFAIISVIILHFAQSYLLSGSAALYITSHPVKTWILNFFNHVFSACGVDIFVFLSGMGMFYSMSHDSDKKRFYQRRFGRILPAYLLIGIPFWIAHTAILNEPAINFFKDFFFVSFFTEGTVTLWFIGFILVMYLLYPYIHEYLFFPKTEKARTIRLAVLTVLMYSIAAFISALMKPHNLAGEIVLTRGPVFVLGAYFGPIIKEKKTYNKTSVILVSVAAIFTGLAFEYYGITDFFYRIARTAFALGVMILLSMLLDKYKKDNNKNIIYKVLAFSGRYSLELYMLHVVIRNIVTSLGLPIYRISVYSAVVAASYALAVPVHWICQKADSCCSLVRSKMENV